MAVKTKAVQRRTGGWWLLLKCLACKESLALTIGGRAANDAGGIRAWTGRRARCRCGRVMELDVVEQRAA